MSSEQARRPRLAVFKFASCDGCQLSVLNLEDDLLALGQALDIAFFPEASSRMEEGPYDVALVEGSITTAEDAERILEVRRQSQVLITIGACATAGGIQALRNWTMVEAFRRAVYPRPESIATLERSTPIALHVHVDLELWGCPIDKEQLRHVLTDLLGAIAIKLLARVEGEGALRVTVRDGVVDDVELRIFEPPRFFEAFLRGRHVDEVPDLVARICGICPVAYQMSAVHALERTFEVRVDGALRDLRRLLYCGEWIESHALHVYLLHAPDFLGYESGIAMARDHRAAVERGLRLKKAGNRILEILGGRSVHPVSVKVGGFSRVPRRTELAALREELRWARDAAVETVRWVAGFEFPDFTRDYTFVALAPADEYPFNEGPIASNRGLRIDADDFESRFAETQVAHSTALHCTVDGGAYLTGPLARLALNHERLSPLARHALAATGLRLPLTNPFHGIVARAVEIVFAVEEAERLIDRYEPPAAPAVPVRVRAGVGVACTEAPRGALYHRYVVDGAGLIQEAKIVPPTSQNQMRIEDDLRAFVPRVLGLDHAGTALACEKVIRSYDPCISCATHFLRLEVVDG